MKKEWAVRQANRRQRLKQEGCLEVRFHVPQEDQERFKRAAESQGTPFNAWAVEVLRRAVNG